MQLDPIFLQNYLDAIERQNTQYYGKGGKVVDFLAEVLKGESKKATKEAPAASRRKVLGLDPKTVPPGQVAVKETVTRAPKKGETSVTLEEIANIPMSRRDVMRLGAGQLGRGLIPQGALRSAMGLVGEAPVGAIKSVAEGSGFPSTIPGVIAHAFRKGLDEDETLALLQRLDLADEANVMYTLPVMRNPVDFAVNIGDEIPDLGPRQALGQMLGVGSGLDIRKTLREVMRENPEMYDKLKEVAKDISYLSTED